MKNLLFIILGTLLLTSCTTNVKEEEVVKKDTIVKVVKDTVIKKDSIVKTK